MKKFNTLFTLLIAAAMVLAMSITIFAASGGTITITVPTTEQAPTVATEYNVYKVFDATVSSTDSSKVSYSLCNGPLTPAMEAAGFSVDTAGNVSGPASLDEDAIAAIAAYVAGTDPVATVTAAVGDTTVTTDTLPYGYYYITTSTGSVVTIDSNNNNPTVNDKNIIPKVVKSAGTQYDATSLAAIAAVGTDQPFTAQITKTHGATNLVFEDTMTNLSYNEDVAITVSAGTAPSTTQAVVTKTENGFKVTFANDYIAGLADGTVITLNYTGKVTSDALSTNPATNKATLTSGDGNTSTSDVVKVYNAKFTVTKTDNSNPAKPLPDAGFVIKNSDGAYYCLASDKKSITWYELADGETLKAAIAAKKVTEYTSNAEGAVTAFTGLADGTYTLVESTTPEGYNTADDYDFTISGSDYTTTNLEQKTTVVNKSGAELPSTGGIGTVIFYVLGSLLVIGAGIVLVARRRMNAN